MRLRVSRIPGTNQFTVKTPSDTTGFHLQVRIVLSIDEVNSLSDQERENLVLKRAHEAFEDALDALEEIGA